MPLATSLLHHLLPSTQDTPSPLCTLVSKGPLVFPVTAAALLRSLLHLPCSPPPPVAAAAAAAAAPVAVVA